MSAAQRQPDEGFGDRSPGGEDPTVRAAARFAALISIAGVAFLVIAAAWASSCNEAAVETAACGVPQRVVLALGSPVIFFIGAVTAFVRTYRLYRDDRTWWGWQGAGWFLIMLCFLILLMAGPPIVGPPLFGAE